MIEVICFYKCFRSTRIKLEREYEDRDRKSRSYLDTKNERKKSRWDNETADFERGHAENHSKDHHGRMTKTLDGKKAGLQDAKASREETKALKRREIEEFKMVYKQDLYKLFIYYLACCGYQQ